MLVGLHGTSAIKICAILVANYAIAKLAGGSRFAVALTWIFNGGVLYLNEVNGGYKFGDIHPVFATLVQF